jgi:hypothetical protein
VGTHTGCCPCGLVVRAPLASMHDMVYRRAVCVGVTVAACDNCMRLLYCCHTALHDLPRWPWWPIALPHI